ncbi:MAG TPA: nitrate reductase molybdenum cofactor assembly chaperone [Terriglobales bacterium]|nr:nitrate reductase molybdenum cofactor assembly chaperone [Terriglobales bacterium]
MSVLRRRARPPFKLLSLLLQYPGDEVLANRPAIAEAIAALPPSPARTGLERFFARFAGAPAVELQQEYVETFDLQRRCSLYLTYGTEGDTRRRGMALLRLKRLYAAGGLSLEGSELPDYLPVMLEFAALAPDGHGRRLLAEHRAGLELLRMGLRERASPYLALVEVVCADLPRPAAGELERLRTIAAEGPPTEEVGLQPFAPPEVMPAQQARR